MKVVPAAMGTPAGTAIDGVSTIEGIDPPTTRRHIKLGLTGMPPCKRGRKTMLPAPWRPRLSSTHRGAAWVWNHIHWPTGSSAVLFRALRKGTELEDKFKGGVVSKSMVQGFLARHSKEVWSQHPQNMPHLRALWSTKINQVV